MKINRLIETTSNDVFKPSIRINNIIYFIHQEKLNTLIADVFGTKKEAFNVLEMGFRFYLKETLK